MNLRSTLILRFILANVRRHQQPHQWAANQNRLRQISH